MTASESDRILAPGVPLTLAGERAVTLRFTFRSLKAFEDAFGSIGAATALLNGLIPDRPGEPASNTKAVSTIVPILAAGLQHEGLTEDDLYDGDLLEHDRLTSVYFDAIAQALDQAFPAPASGRGKAEEAAPASSGDASTTPPPASAATTTPSGA